MNAKGVIILAVFLVSISAGLGWAGSPVAVSPGDAAGTAISNQICPTFSWSSADGAVSYRLELYEQVTTDVPPREAMDMMAKPVSAKDIAAPALSWTPSSDECLTRGMKYVWYVRGAGRNGAGQWSEGRAFQVEAEALSVEQKDAVQEVVKEYLAKEAAKAAALSTAEASPASGVTVTRLSEAPARTEVSKGSGVTPQTVSTGVEVIGDLSIQGTGNLIVMGTLDVGYEIVTTGGTLINIPGGNCLNYGNGACYYVTVVYATCPAGKKVIGGGCSISGAWPYDANLARSFPQNSTQWRCDANSSLNTAYLIPYAICAKIQ